MPKTPHTTDAPSEARERGEPIRILYVEDDPDVTELTVSCLEREDDRFTVETAPNATAGLEQLTSDVDCLVSTDDLPDMTGLEFLEIVRETRPDLPFVLFTRDGSEAVASDAISATMTESLQRGAGTQQIDVLADRIADLVEHHRAQARLEWQTERCKTVVTNDPLGVFMLDADGVFMLSQGRRLGKLGFEPSEVVGKSVSEVCADCDDVVAAAERALTGEPATAIHEFEGTLLETVTHPLGNDDGSVRAVIGVVIEITEHTEYDHGVEAERQYLRDAFEHLPQPMVELDYEGDQPVAKRVNSAFEEVFGDDANVVLGESLDTRVDPGEQQETATDSDRAETTGQLVSEEVTRQTPDGDREFRRHIAVSDDGSKAFAVYTDVTDCDLQSARLARRSELFNVLTRVLRHNLRNDMAVIRGYLTELQKRIDSQCGLCDAILDATDDLLNLSETVRELDAIVRADFDRQQIDLVSLCRSVITSVEQEYPSASFSLDGPETVTIVTTLAVRRAIEELVRNAAKHAGTNPQVTVSLEPTADEVTVSVTDNGPGLPKPEREVLSDGTETPLEHETGLGLWLANWIVTDTGGAMETEVSADGTRVILSLPRDPSATDHSNARTTTHQLYRDQDRFKAVFEESFDGMVIFDDDGRCINVNESAADLVGRSREDITGRSLFEILPAEFDFEMSVQEFKQSDQWHGSVPLVRRDGTKRTVECFVTPEIVPDQHLAILRETDASL